MKKGNIIELITNDNVESNGRKFTRVYGGFGDDNPIITDLQIAKLLDYKKGARQVRETFDRNSKHFEENIDFIDISKGVAESDTLKETLVLIGYAKASISQAKNIYIFSEAGFLLFLKFAEGDRAIETYKNFIEDYFKTKAELKSAEQTLIESKQAIMEERKYIMGSIIFETDTQKKLELIERDKKLQDDISNIDKELTKQKVMKELEDKLAIADRFTNRDGLYDIGKFSKILDIKGLGRNKLFEWMRDKKLLMKDNSPYQNQIEHFKVIYTNKNGNEYSKTLLKSKGISYIVKKLIEDKKIEIDYSDIMAKIDKELKPEKNIV